MTSQNNHPVDMGRRHFITTTSGLILLGNPLLSNVAFADDNNYWGRLTRLSPQRIIGGLVFDLIAPILVEVGKNMVQRLFSGSYSSSSLRYYSSATSAISSGREFSADNYKASVVILGVADYERYKQERVKLLLNRQQDEQRFLLLQQYLKDENIAIKTRDSEVSFSVGRYLEPNDLFSVEYFVTRGGGKMQEHYKNMEQIARVTAFRKLII